MLLQNVAYQALLVIRWDNITVQLKHVAHSVEQLNGTGTNTNNTKSVEVFISLLCQLGTHEAEHEACYKIPTARRLTVGLFLSDQGLETKTALLDIKLGNAKSASGAQLLKARLR